MGDSEYESTELFAKVESGKPWEYQRQFFPSKIGGRPAWLEPENLPQEEAFVCPKCAGVMTFVLQLYAPDDEEPSGDAFHRTIYLFACQPCGTHWRALRSQLPRTNAHYASHPQPYGMLFPQPDTIIAQRCCPACGLPSDGEPKPGEQLTFASVVHDFTSYAGWRALHPRCKIATTQQTLEATLPEALLRICEGEILEPENYLAHEKELYRKYQEMKAQRGAGDEEELDESEEKAIEAIQEERLVVDRNFERFCKRTTPNDVVYYCRDGKPMWTSDRAPKLTCATTKDAPEDKEVVPVCSNCGGQRSFEFQVLPQMLVHLGPVRLDFASVAVYTCAASCNLLGQYQEEFVYVEPDLSLAPK
ncbi:programmed cell death protein 2, putative [Babesia bigemina]|uniref:Programmed cell death protein 2, putative n=1 Tax=Babesia bigemina TaxID=5866 RepID=A0A061D2E8_BABBI|nr:programmed cell death protein 2, putative [Babesia bigemina]CDR94773.1 programmed cell death protein 2, putative [Babesia bigemina]|eukprot:XP_012766959.1 programmed cell death protein 2, putative [Babesia bigemina]